jgi:hypothetical protein
MDKYLRNGLTNCFGIRNQLIVLFFIQLLQFVNPIINVIFIRNVEKAITLFDFILITFVILVKEASAFVIFRRFA